MFNKVGSEFLTELERLSVEKSESAKLEKFDPSGGLEQVFRLIKGRHTIQDISSRLSLPEKLVSIQVETLIREFPELDIDYLLEKDIVNGLKRIEISGDKKKDELKSLLEKISDHNLVRIARAKYSN
jgi:hypothetical protein